MKQKLRFWRFAPAFLSLGLGVMAFAQPPVVVRPRNPNHRPEQRQHTIEAWVGTRLGAGDRVSVRDLLGVDSDYAGMSVAAIQVTAYRTDRYQADLSLEYNHTRVSDTYRVAQRPVNYLMRIQPEFHHRSLDIDIRDMDLFTNGDLFIESIRLILNMNGRRLEEGRYTFSNYEATVHARETFWLDELFRERNYHPLDRVVVQLEALEQRRDHRDDRRDRRRRDDSRRTETARLITVKVCSSDSDLDCDTVEVPEGETVSTIFHFEERHRQRRRTRDSVDLHDLSFQVLGNGYVNIRNVQLVEEEIKQECRRVEGGTVRCRPARDRDDVRRDHERRRGRDRGNPPPRRDNGRGRRNCTRSGNVVVCTSAQK